jgi:uncharacterized membrane protein YeiH
MTSPHLLTALEHFAVATGACSGVLAGSGKRVDLFGVLVLGLVTAFGGGTLRDVLLGAYPVVWVARPELLSTGLGAALVTFFAARHWEFPAGGLLVADAFGLALFTVLGARRAAEFAAAQGFALSPVAEIGFGVVTGVAGGVLRDALMREIPLVFRKDIYLYATAALAGAAVLILGRELGVPEQPRWLLASGTTLALRLAAIRWKLTLPLFRSRHEPPAAAG